LVSNCSVRGCNQSRACEEQNLASTRSASARLQCQTSATLAAFARSDALPQENLPLRGQWRGIKVRACFHSPPFFHTMSTAVAEQTTTQTSQLEQLKRFTKVVADTGDFETMREFKPQDATTNPSLIFQATQKAEYNYLLEKVLENRKSSGLTGAAQIDDVIDYVLVAFGQAILEIVPGRVSTEVDARLSFDTEATLAKARHLISLYEAAGVSRDRC
jgi:hypothetical protein